MLIAMNYICINNSIPRRNRWKRYLVQKNMSPYFPSGKPTHFINLKYSLYFLL